MALRLSEDEYAALMAKRQGAERQPAPAALDGGGQRYVERRRPKYGNRRVEIDGMRFDSQHEADYYVNNLLIRWRCGELRLLARQVPFDLPGGIRYLADFVTVDQSGNVSVIDAKSAVTRGERVYINKKKQMRAIWGIDIVEV